MYYAIMYRSSGGDITTMKPRFTSIPDAEEQVEYANPWLTRENWVRENGGSHAELTDGSQFIIWPEV